MSSRRKISQNEKYDAAKDETLTKVVKGKSPLWIRGIMAVFRAWFFIYDILNYLPYQLFNSPVEKLRKSGRVKARFVDEEERDGPIRHVDGLASEYFLGKNTLDKYWRHTVELYDEAPCLGTRQLLQVHEDKQENGRVFEKWEMGEYVWESYREVESHVQRLAAGFKDLVKESPDSKVVIFAETRAHWVITALSCFRARVPIVTVYATLGEDAIAHAINETDSTILVTSAELLSKIGNLQKKCNTLKTLVYFPQVNPLAAAPSLDGFRSQFEHVFSLNGLESRNKERIKESEAKPDDIALIMYTSGTTGQPKGVMLTHRNIVAAIAGESYGVPIICDTDTYIGYLPLAHILELSAELTCLGRGAKIGYSSPLTLHDRASKIQKGTHGDCWALRPTLMAAVPAIMDRIFKAVSEEVAASPRFMQELFKLNYERKRARYQEGYCSPFLDRIIFKKIRSLLGGRLRGVLAGGAALNPETQRFMNICMCCPVIQGYGLTETCGAACIADINDLSTGTVGPPVRCADIVLREWKEGSYSPWNDPPQGEILIAGDHVSIGYWKQPEKTAEDFIEYKGCRYFCTGDIGQKRDDGSILIIDRKKDLIKLMHGEYISLAKVECALLNCPLLDNICVYGDSFADYVVALVIPNQKHLERIAKEVGEGSTDMKAMCENQKVTAEFLKQMGEHAKQSNLSRVEMPKQITLLPEIWTPDTGLLTEALKLKRKPIQDKYQKVLKKMYGK
ncbi:hypothetical protein WR25_05731 [Diploscapter pachys]|uniref:long-chain-fatty-acid--CoA ligase n=1 Tax=Diploscapter pachys TaxID=2018661 RepID=A0A2A2LVA2_9BILA|nr:hypothetical protein WR25_05731 [Diploscapter pachys]